MESLIQKGWEIAIPEIADYEIRRELLRAEKKKGILKLDALKSAVTYIPIHTKTMLKAAEFWAEVRKKGKPTADSKALDGDVILAAQAFLFKTPNSQTIIATTNVRHLSLLNIWF